MEQGGVDTSHRKSRRGAFVAMAFLVAAVLVAAFTFINRGTKKIEEVRVADAAQGDVVSRILAQGSVRAKRQVEVGSEFSGRVISVDVEIGHRVKIGDLLFTVDDTQLKNAVKQLQVGVSAARALHRKSQLMLDESKRTHARDERLAEKGVVTKDALSMSLARLSSMQADVQQAFANLERTRLDLERTEDTLKKTGVRAPINGIVVAVGVEVGQVVGALSALPATSSLFASASPGSASTSNDQIVVADLSEIIARLDVDELDISQVKVGQKTTLMPQGKDANPVIAVVTRVGLMGKDTGGAVQFPVEATVKDPRAFVAGGRDAGPVTDAETIELRPGMTVSAEIEVGRLANAVHIPVSAVLEGDGEKKSDRVFELGITQSVTEIKVKLGPSDGDNVAILEGVDVGDTVITGPFRALRTLQDGDFVEVADEDEDEKVTLVRTQALSRHYQMGGETVRALENVDLEIGQSELLAIMGPSGSGKSTLMNIIGCLDTPTTGTFELAGIDVSSYDKESLAEVRNRHIGFVFQSFQLLPRQTALENVTLPLVYRRQPDGNAIPQHIREEKARQSLDVVGLSDRALHRPNEMSGGQRQRVAIARALVGEPSIILADEPTGNLDSKTSEEILDILIRLNREKKRTVIIVTHENDICDRCDRVIRLRDGMLESDERKDAA